MGGGGWGWVGVGWGWVGVGGGGWGWVQISSSNIAPKEDPLRVRTKGDVQHYTPPQKKKAGEA